jgi:hypothetical protein
MEKIDPEPEDDGSFMMETIRYLKENDEGEIPTEGPYLGYDTVFTYHGYDFSIEHLPDNDGSFYNVVVYKSNLTDDDEAYITEQILPSWIDVMRYARNFDSCKANRFRNSWHNGVETEPEDDGNELNESVDLDTPEIPPLELGETETYRYKGYEAVITCEENEEGEYYYARIFLDSDENHVVCRREVIYTEWDLLLEYIKMYASAHPLHKDEKTEPEDDGADMLESLLNETKPSRFNKHLDDKEKSFATISAERSMPQIDNRERQRALNHRRTKVLEKLLKVWGLKGFIKTKGGFDEKGQPRVEINGNLSEEDSFFVPNITKEQAIRLGKLFNQDSVMFKDKGSNKIKELRTNIKGGDEGIGNETGLVFVTCQGRHNIGHDKTYYTRTKSSPVKFAFNPEDESE